MSDAVKTKWSGSCSMGYRYFISADQPLPEVQGQLPKVVTAAEAKARFPNSEIDWDTFPPGSPLIIDEDLIEISGIVVETPGEIPGEVNDLPHGQYIYSFSPYIGELRYGEDTMSATSLEMSRRVISALKKYVEENSVTPVYLVRLWQSTPSEFGGEEGQEETDVFEDGLRELCLSDLDAKGEFDLFEKYQTVKIAQ